MTGYRLTQIKSNGQVNTSEFTGYSAETAMIHFRKEILADKYTVSLFVFEITEGGMYLRTFHHQPEFQ